MNARHVKAVSGRKTDVKDAEWLADLLRHGLVRPSFIPPVEQRDLRELTRQRSNFVREQTNLVNRVQETLESANIKLAAVATDIMGVSGQAMLAALLEGHSDPAIMAELSKDLEDRVKPHHRFILTELLSQIDSLDETLERFNEQIERACCPFEEAVALWIPFLGGAEERHSANSSKYPPGLGATPTTA